MGRIKTAAIKRKTRELLQMAEGQFTTDFETNKKVAAQFAVFGSKKQRNLIAGYMTRLKKRATI